MDIMTLILAALAQSGALSYGYELLQRLNGTLDKLGPGLKRLILFVCSVGAVLLGSWMHQSLPADLSGWTADTFNGVVIFLLTQLWHLVRKHTEGVTPA